MAKRKSRAKTTGWDATPNRPPPNRDHVGFYLLDACPAVGDEPQEAEEHRVAAARALTILYRERLIERERLA